MAIDTAPQTLPWRRIALSLSREELYVVMRLLKARQIPGFDTSWLHTDTDEHMPKDVRLSLEVAANDLIARGYLSKIQLPTDAEPLQLTMPSPLIALVGACAFSEFTMFLSLQRTPDGPRMLYLHGLRALGVVHTMPLPNVHQFEAVPNRNGIVDIIDEVLHLADQPAPELRGGTISSANVEPARDAATAGDVEQAATLLQRDGLPAETAYTLAAAMKDASVMGAIISSKRAADNQVAPMACAVVVTPALCFLLTGSEATPQMFELQPLSAYALRKLLANTLFTT